MRLASAPAAPAATAAWAAGAGKKVAGRVVEATSGVGRAPAAIACLAAASRPPLFAPRTSIGLESNDKG